jgi:nucleotide-binding universal stress UspA family protein
MMKKVLIAYDGSEHSKKAFDVGLDLASRYAAEVIVLAVARVAEPPEDVETEAAIESASEFYEKQFVDLRQQATAKGVKAQFEIRPGHAADQIVLVAKQEGVDVIVMGHRGRSRVSRWLLGSISKRVLSYAHCSVFIVR